MKIEMPRNVETAINLLIENGYKAYAVGGCIRDSLLGFAPDDWDITTSATPEETEKVFSDYKVIETGVKHGTVTVIIDKTPLEITTFRIDGQYKDFRHPESVSFTSEISEDLSRRDFTVNAMCYNHKEGIIDCFGGKQDLENRIIRCVRKPDERFNEDALRILRALRFASVLGFEIEKDTSESIFRNRHLLGSIAAERIQKELVKLLCGKNVEDILLKYSSVIFTIIKELEPLHNLKQVNKYNIYNAWEHTVRSVACINPDPKLRVAMLLHDIGKAKCTSTDQSGISHFYGHPKVSEEMADKILHSLKFPKKFIESVLILIKNHDAWVYNNPHKLGRWINQIGEENLRDLLEVMRADILAQSPKFNDRLELIDECVRKIDDIVSSKECVRISELSVNGNDIQAFGITDGKEIGLALEFLLNEVMDKRVKNEKELLLIHLKNNTKQ